MGCSCDLRCQYAQNDELATVSKELEHIRMVESAVTDAMNASSKDVNAEENSKNE